MIAYMQGLDRSTVQVVQRQGHGGGGAAERDARADRAAADGRAEFRDRFVSLVDPAGVLDMERAGRAAAGMREAASRSGYANGARMAGLLADTFADVAEISGRPVDDGALYHTSDAFRRMMTLLYGTAESYRDGGDGEPVGELEELRRSVALLRSQADAHRAELRAAGGPPGSGLCKHDSLFSGRICKDTVRERIEKIRAERKARGVDPIFTPKEGTVGEILAKCDGPKWSAAEILDWARGKGPPDGYELVWVGKND